MANETPKTQGVPADALAPLILGSLDYALAAGERRALELGAPTHRVVELLLNHLASVASMVEPPQAREMLVKDLVGAFAGMVRKHVDARFTTPGGIKLPGAGA